MKKTMLFVLTGMLFCAGIAFSQGTPVNGEWSPYTDVSEGGKSTVAMTQVTQDGQPAFRFAGKIVNDNPKVPYTFAGWELVPDAASLAAIKALKATSTISFKVKGDGNRYTVEMRSTRVKDYGYHAYNISTTAGQTQTVSIQLRQFLQPGWGAAVGPFSPATFEKFSIQTHEALRKPGETIPYDLTVWDLRVTP